MVKKTLRILGITSLVTEFILIIIALVTQNDDNELSAWFMGLFLIPIGLILLLITFFKKN